MYKGKKQRTIQRNFRIVQIKICVQSYNFFFIYTILTLIFCWQKPHSPQQLLHKSKPIRSNILHPISIQIPPKCQNKNLDDLLRVLRWSCRAINMLLPCFNLTPKTTISLRFVIPTLTPSPRFFRTFLSKNLCMSKKSSTFARFFGFRLQQSRLRQRMRTEFSSAKT